MNSYIHENADRIAEEFRAMGRSVRVSHSVNRNNDESSYLEVSGLRIRLRISDHFSGTTDAADFQATTTAAEIIDYMDRAAASEKAHRTQQEAIIEAREKPYFDAWLAASRQHDREMILHKVYPTDKPSRQALQRKWLRREAETKALTPEREG